VEPSDDSAFGSTPKPWQILWDSFLSPRQREPLIEVIHTDTTTLDTLRRVKVFAASLRTVPIVIRDSPGFLLNRLLVPYLNETLELLQDGGDIPSLDRAAADFGMPNGPLASFDEFGIEVGRSLYQAFPERIVPSELLIAIYKSGRLGRKSGSGFYCTQQHAAAGRVDLHVLDMIRERQRTDNRPSEKEIRRRLFLLMLLEATRVLQEAPVENSFVVDSALRNGLGMLRSDCGVFAWADKIGARTLIDWLQPLQPLGKRFEPTQRLLVAARKDATLCESSKAVA